MDKRVLIVAVASPPNGGSHATRIFAMVEGFHNSGWEVTVLTCTVSESQKADSTLYSRMKAISKIIESEGGALRSAATSIGKMGRSRSGLARHVQWLRASVRKFMLPDTFLTWVPGAVSAGVRKAKDNRINLVVSSGAPFSSHIAGYLISRIASVPLALDYGDPWVYEPGRPRKGLRLLIERFVENKILRAARLVSVTTNETVSLYRKFYPGNKCLYHNMPMGYDSSDYGSKDLVCRVRKDKMSFVYAGRINEEYRSLDGLLSVLEYEYTNPNNLKVEFVFYGAELEALRKSLGKYLDCGLVRFGRNLDHQEYILALEESDGLVIFGNNSLIQIPGKVPHFLAARRSILYFCNLDSIEDDPSFNLLKRVQTRGLFSGDTVDSYLQYRTACENDLEPVIDESALNSLEWSNISKCYVQAIEKLI